MPSPTTDLELCNAALVKLGAAPITAFTTADAVAGISQVLYPLTVDAVLTAHPWSFSLRRVALTPAAGRPPADHRHRFILPDDFIRTIDVADGSKRTPDYRLVGSELQTNAEQIVLTYQFNAGVAAFPAFFRAALVARLAAELCLPLTESSSRAEALDRMAERELARAWAVDRAQETPVVVNDDSLTTARFR
ncbi:MAG: hypothetical protein AAFX81_00920 [Pseudomonadota bacterium]